MKSPAKKPTPKRGAGAAFKSLRKPIAPPGHPLTRAKPEERAHPAERKAKHKRPAEDENDEE